jgi:hypothetical protein
MAESRPDPKSSARSVPGRYSQALRARRHLAPVQTGVNEPRSRRQRIDDQVYALESDLSDGMVVSDRELEAIARLLGDELEGVLSGPGRS